MSEPQSTPTNWGCVFWIVVLIAIGLYNVVPWHEFRQATPAGLKREAERQQRIANGQTRGHYEFLPRPALPPNRPHRAFVDDDLGQQVVTDPNGEQQVVTPPD